VVLAHRLEVVHPVHHSAFLSYGCCLIVLSKAAGGS
jgi:hypothetical protein